MKILGISGSLVGSKTSILVKKQLKELQNQNSNYETEFIDLKEYKLDFCDGRPYENYSEDTKKIIQKCQDADGFLIGTTILHGSLPGALKNLFELVPPIAFAEKVVAFTANGGNPNHYLAVENYIKPIATYLGMYVCPKYFYAIPSDFNEKGEIASFDKEQELKMVVEQFKFFLSKLNRKIEVI